MSAIRATLRQLAYDALLGNTIAGQNVFLPRDWPTGSAVMPSISIQTPRESKHNASGRIGPPRFNTVTWLQLRCQVQGTDPGQVESDLETLVDAVELAVMGLLIGPPQRFQQIVQGEYEMSLSSDQAQHIGEATLQFGVEYAERFDALPAPAFTGIDITAAEGPDMGQAILATAVADTLSGTVLHFAVPLNPKILGGLYVLDRTNPAALSSSTGVESVDLNAGTVTMTAAAVGAGVKAGDTIAFVARVLAEIDIDLPSS